MPNIEGNRADGNSEPKEGDQPLPLAETTARHDYKAKAADAYETISQIVFSIDRTAWEYFSRFWRKVWVVLDEPTFTDYLVAISTIIIAIATWQTYREIQASSGQTVRLVTASESIQSDLDKANRENRRASHRTMRQSQIALANTVSQMKEQSSAMHGAAVSSDISATAAQQQARAFEEVEAAQLVADVTPQQSPGVLKATIEGDSILIDWDIAATNVGLTVAKGLYFSVHTFDIAGTTGGYTEPPEHPFTKLISTPSPIGSPLKANDTVHFRHREQIPGWEEVKDSKESVVIYTQISYVDIFGRPRFVPLCVYFDLSSNGFIHCP